MVMVASERNDPLAAVAASPLCYFINYNILHTFAFLEVSFQSGRMNIEGDISAVEINAIKLDTESAINQRGVFDTLLLCEFTLIIVIGHNKFLSLACCTPL